MDGSHSHYTVLIQAATSSPKFKVGGWVGDIDSTSWKGSGKILDEHLAVGDIFVAMLEKHTLT